MKKFLTLGIASALMFFALIGNTAPVITVTAPQPTAGDSTKASVINVNQPVVNTPADSSTAVVVKHKRKQ